MRFGPFEQYQATAPATIPLPPDYDEDCGETAVYWLSASGVLVNSHGCTIMIDPLLSLMSDDPATGETGELLMTAPPILATQVTQLDAVLYTHTDNDHLGPLTASHLMQTGAQFHGTPMVIRELHRIGLSQPRGVAHTSGETFHIGELEITVTPAFHPHQLFNTHFESYFTPEDCCGYKIRTPDGVIWIPGDSLLMNEHLQMKDVDLLFIDFSDNASHFGLDFAIGLANVLEHAEMIMYHWATFYGPDHDWCNADPSKALPRLRHPERLHILAPGEKYILRHNERRAAQ
jgi:L-ascorbate metabolism protein UlaG (beta-lactamase superfamily)